MRNFKTLSFLICIICSPLCANAAVTDPWVTFGAKRIVQTGSGPAQFYARGHVTRQAAKAIVNKALRRQAASSVGGPILASVAAVSGAYFLYSDLSRLIDYYKAYDGLYTELTVINSIVNSNNEIMIDVSGPFQCGYYEQTSTKVSITVTDSYARITSHETRPFMDGDPYQYWTIGARQGDGTFQTIFAKGKTPAIVVIDNRSPQVKQQYPSQTTISIDDAKLEQALNESPNLWTDPAYVNTTIVPADGTAAQTAAQPYSEPPTGTLTDTPVTDPGTSPSSDDDTQIDPATGEPVSPVEPTPSDQQDQMDTPNQPTIPDFDTNIIAPDKKSISPRVRQFIDNAPFMAIGRSIRVSASGEQSVFNIPTPFGSTGVMDFGQWSWLWSAISAIVIGISYIYAAQIVFGGKA